MALTLFYSLPALTNVTEINQIDTFVGDGTTTTFDLINKSYTQVGSTCQYGTTEPLLWTGGFVKNNDDSVTFASAPPAGVQGVIPGLGAANLYAYDTDSVEGVTTPRYGYSSVWVGDIDEIYLYKYTPRAGKPGIELFFVNNITGGGLPDLSWVSSSSGNALTWTASGVSLYTDKIAGFSTVAASANSGQNSILVTSATGDDYFIVNDYVIFNIGNGTSEILQIASKSYNMLTFASSFNYPHYVDEPVFTCLRQIDLRLVVPEGATANTAKNYYNISYKINANQTQRS